MKKYLAKLVCLTAFIVAFIGILATDNQAVRPAQAFSTGPDPGRTGAPGENTCATGECHGLSRNTGPGRFVLLAPEKYAPGKTYQVVVRHETGDGTRMRWGFQLTALTAANEKAGNFQSLNDQTFVINLDRPDFKRQYIEHSANGTFRGQTGQAFWVVNWTAPPADVGPITFYGAGNQADNDGTNVGDQIYTTNVTVAFTPGEPTASPPKIFDASVSGKKLIVIGMNFAAGAELFIDGKRQKKTANDADSPATVLIDKKAGKKIARAQKVKLQVKNPGGPQSEEFEFTRP